jgi:hypothetical protein
MGVFALFGYTLLVVRPDSTPVRTLSLIFAGIMLEAIPFMLLGSLVGGLIEEFISRERMAELLPKRGWITVALAAGIGLIFPVCECAIVPVIRRLARKGLPASATIAYLLGAPVVNPLVAASTALAYKFDWRVVGIRMAVGYGIAVAVALVMGRLFDNAPIFRQGLVEPPRDGANASGHAHGRGERACAHGCVQECGHGAHGGSFLARLASAGRHGVDDFMGVAHFLVIGAFLAALAQTLVDRRVFLALSDIPLVSSLLMISLAVLLNLCSEADAFIAASFQGVLPLPAQMAFMLTGPIFDLKLLLMYQKVFRKRAIVTLSAVILLTVCLVSLAMQLIF